MSTTSLHQPSIFEFLHLVSSIYSVPRYLCSETNLTTLYSFCRGPVVFAGAVPDMSGWHQNHPWPSLGWYFKCLGLRGHPRGRREASGGLSSHLLDLNAKRSEVQWTIRTADPVIFRSGSAHRWLRALVLYLRSLLVLISSRRRRGLPGPRERRRMTKHNP